MFCRGGIVYKPQGLSYALGPQHLAGHKGADMDKTYKLDQSKQAWKRGCGFCNVTFIETCPVCGVAWVGEESVRGVRLDGTAAPFPDAPPPTTTPPKKPAKKTPRVVPTGVPCCAACRKELAFMVDRRALGKRVLCVACFDVERVKPGARRAVATWGAPVCNDCCLQMMRRAKYPDEVGEDPWQCPGCLGARIGPTPSGDDLPAPFKGKLPDLSPPPFQPTTFVRLPARPEDAQRAPTITLQGPTKPQGGKVVALRPVVEDEVPEKRAAALAVIPQLWASGRKSSAVGLMVGLADPGKVAQRLAVLKRIDIAGKARGTLTAEELGEREFIAQECARELGVDPRAPTSTPVPTAPVAPQPAQRAQAALPATPGDVLRSGDWEGLWRLAVKGSITDEEAKAIAAIWLDGGVSFTSGGGR